jgi:hypothetical protein
LEVRAVTDIALRSVGLEQEPADGGPAVEVMFRFLGAGVRVRSSSVALLQHWTSRYGAFRVPPGPAAITVWAHGDREGRPLPGRVTIEGPGVRVVWQGDGEILPPLGVPPLSAWMFLEGAAVARAGQAVMLVGGAGAGKTLLAVCAVAMGGSLLADGLLPLDPRDLLLAPFPEALRLRHAELALLGIDPAHPALVPFRAAAGTVEWRADPVALLGPRSARLAAEVAAIVFLEPAAARERLRPLPAEQALPRLLRCLRRPQSGRAEAERRLGRLCQRTPAYLLTPGMPDTTARLLHRQLLG